MHYKVGEKIRTKQNNEVQRWTEYDRSWRKWEFTNPSNYTVILDDRENDYVLCEFAGEDNDPIRKIKRSQLQSLEVTYQWAGDTIQATETGDLRNKKQGKSLCMREAKRFLGVITDLKSLESYLAVSGLSVDLKRDSLTIGCRTGTISEMQEMLESFIKKEEEE